jgi:DNA-binding MarR family transcriptional regulator
MLAASGAHAEDVVLTCKQEFEFGIAPVYLKYRVIENGTKIQMGTRGAVYDLEKSTGTYVWTWSSGSNGVPKENRAVVDRLDGTIVYYEEGQKYASGKCQKGEPKLWGTFALSWDSFTNGTVANLLDSLSFQQQNHLLIWLSFEHLSGWLMSEISTQEKGDDHALPSSDSVRTARRAMLDKYIGIVEQYQKIRPTISTQEVFFFLHVAKDEGRTLAELSRATGIPLATTSRYLQLLSKRLGPKSPGLIHGFRSLEDSRRLQVVLAPEGRKFFNCW